MKKIQKLVLKLVVSGALFWLLFSQIDPGSLSASFSNFDLKYLIIIFTLLIANYLISSIRWKKLLIFPNSEKVSLGFLMRLYFIGAFFNNFMPTSIGGDVYKILKLGDKLQSKAHAFSATFMERFTGIITLVLISYIGLISTLHILLALFPQQILNNRNLTLVAEFLLFFGFWIAAAGGYLALRLASRKIEKIQRIRDSLAEYKGKHKVLAFAFITSIVVQLLAVFTQYFIFVALGVEVPILYALFVLPVITIASFFIPSLNGIGVQDTLYVQLFMPVGVPVEVALSASIIYHLVRLAVSLIGGVLYATGQDD